MVDISSLVTSVRSFLTQATPAVESMSDVQWNGQDGFLPIIVRAMVRRQHDALAAIVDLCIHERGYAAAPMLRPSCEELIWLKYLAGIDKTAAEWIVSYLTIRDLNQSLRVERKFSGKRTFRTLGFPDDLINRSERHHKTVARDINPIGAQLNWPINKHGDHQIPGVKWLAEKTDMLRDYEYLYHATSRFVHFSTHELLRRAWATPPVVSVRSTHFHDYWAAFCLWWGLILYLKTLDTSLEFLGDEFSGIELDSDVIQSVAETLSDFGHVPIVTAEELAR
jgi:hypothetical protein